MSEQRGVCVTHTDQNIRPGLESYPQIKIKRRDTQKAEMMMKGEVVICTIGHLAVSELCQAQTNNPSRLRLSNRQLQ